MNRILKKFLQRGVDLSPVGVELREDNTNYFCTPKGASVFGWAGIDGIHFCFIRGFGEMVFSVSPMNTSPDYVHPVAENFTDFLRLILACGDVAAVEQAWMWNEAQFEAFLNENPTTQEQQQTLSEISEKMNLLPMEQPWTYIKNLQSSFDYSQIKYTEDYYDNDMTSEAELVAPEWKVYFDGDFWGHRGKDRAGKEIKLDKQFDWAGYHWVIPAAYSCSKGLVVDFCMRVDSESIRDFMKKWNLDWENDSCENFTREQQMQMEWENPLCFNFKPCLKLNEKILQTTHGCAVSFNPCLPDGVINELEAKWAIDHYGLDSTYGWVICRDVASSAANSSKEQRTSKTSLKSFSVILATSAPFLGIMTTSPSSSSLRIASRTGVLLTPNRFASAISIRRSPGANSPVMIACLNVLNTTSLNGRYSFMFTFNLSLIVSSPPAFSNVSSILLSYL